MGGVEGEGTRFNFGNTNITDNPIYSSAENGNFQLTESSPCINAGSNDFVEVDTDFEGKKRIVNGIVDIGAYEFNSYYVGIIKQEFPNSINAYPNPTNGIVQLEGLPISEKVMISIYNLSGEIVLQFESSGSNVIVDLSSESPGIYFIKIAGETQHTAKIIKE